MCVYVYVCACTHIHTHTHIHARLWIVGWVWYQNRTYTPELKSEGKGVVMFTKSRPQVSRASCPEVGTRSGPTHQLSLTPISTSDPLSPHTSLRTARTVARGAPFCTPVFSQCWTPQDPSLTFRHGAGVHEHRDRSDLYSDLSPAPGQGAWGWQ